MKAIILAAGVGSRLGERAVELPKCLIDISGKSNLKRQTDMLADFGVLSKDVRIVIGKHGECWTSENNEEIGKLVDNVIINTKNLSTNNGYSLSLALDTLKDDDLIVFDGDLVFREEVLHRIVSKNENMVLSKMSYNLNEKRNKIIVNKDGTIMEISKNLNIVSGKYPFHVYGAMFFIRKLNIKYLKEVLKEPENVKLSLDFILNKLCKIINMHRYSNFGWVNVNTEKNLLSARKLFRSCD